MRELGRIRTGNQVAGGRGKRPNKLETFRLTSESRSLIEGAAEAFGGVVVPWDNNGHPEFEVITTVDALDIVVPPGEPVSQWMELWSGGGCERRCDGVRNVLTMEPCLCPQDVEQRVALAAKGEACKATTRLSVILPVLPGLGVWRLESHGYYAAVHLAGAAEILTLASARGTLIPARLRLVEGTKKIPGQPTRKWFEPVIEMDETRFGALGITTLAPGGPAALAAGAGAAQIGPGVTTGRPTLPSTELPPTSDFRAPAAAPAAQGDVLEADDPDAAPESAPTPAMTHPELSAALEAAGITTEVAIARSKDLFPREPGVPLNDEQRAALFVDLTAPAAVL
jgi:hypothetical protein